MFHVKQGLLALAAVLLLAGCETTRTAPASIPRPVPEAPCKADVPARGVMPADTLTGDEDIFTLGAVLWADRLTRQAYELKLEIIVARCTASPALP